VKIEAFNNFIEIISMIGRTFTWYYANDSVMSILDRVILSSLWFESDSKQYILDRIFSDHRVIIIKHRDCDRDLNLLKHWTLGELTLDSMKWLGQCSNNIELVEMIFG